MVFGSVGGSIVVVVVASGRNFLLSVVLIFIFILVRNAVVFFVRVIGVIPLLVPVDDHIPFQFLPALKFISQLLNPSLFLLLLRMLKSIMKLLIIRTTGCCTSAPGAITILLVINNGIIASMSSLFPLLSILPTLLLLLLPLPLLLFLLHPLFIPPHFRKDIDRPVDAHDVIGYVGVRPRDFVEVVGVVFFEDFDC